MGIGLVLGAISAVVGVAGSVIQANAASQAAREQRRARDIGAAQQRIEGIESRRQRIREERVRRARIIAASEGQGTGGSSGELGAVGALSSNLAGLFSQSLGRSAAAEGINTAQQNAANWLQTANTIGAWTNTIQSGISGFSSVFDKEE